MLFQDSTLQCFLQHQLDQHLQGFKKRAEFSSNEIVIDAYFSLSKR